MVACTLKCTILTLHFLMNLKTFFIRMCSSCISCVHPVIFISSECPFHTLQHKISEFYRTTKVNRSPKMVRFTNKKKQNHKKTFFCNVIIDQLYVSLDFFRRGLGSIFEKLYL